MNFDSLKSLRVSSPAEGVTEVQIASGKGNTMTASFWQEMAEVFNALAADKSVRGIVLTAAGPHFSYGLDLMGMGAGFMTALNGRLSGREQIVEKGRELQEVFNIVARCPKTVIAAVQGYCIGGGVELIAACDMRVASADARFSLREVRMGMVCDLGGIQRLPYVIGEGNLRELALLGEDFDAQRALAIGLVNSVQADAAAAREAALAMAVRAAANPPRVIAGIKQTLNARTEAAVAVSLNQALQLNSSLMQSDDFKEAMMAFVEKRAARFTGN